MSLLWNSRSTAAGNKISKELEVAWRAGWGFNIFVRTSTFRWFPVTPTYSQLCTVSSSVYSGYLLSSYRHGISILSAMEYGVRPFLMCVYCAQARPNSRDDSFSGLESLTIIALSCDPKLSPARQQTTKHNELYPLLSLSLTMPPFIEHFQQCDDPCLVGFYALAFLSLFLQIP